MELIAERAVSCEIGETPLLVNTSSASRRTADNGSKPPASPSAPTAGSSDAAGNANAEPATTSSASEQALDETTSVSSIVLKANGTTLEMTLADTEAASALVSALQQGPLTVELHSYGGFEKDGPLPLSLPTNDRQTTTEPGDVMLYQGNQITVFYGSNTWAYTPLGHIEGATAESLLSTFGDGDVSVELHLS